MKISIIILLFWVAFLPLLGLCQSPQLIDRVANSTYIFDGKITNKYCFWNKSPKTIYTAYEVELYSIFKGDIQSETVVIMVEGGELGDTSLRVSHNFVSGIGQSGMFFCEESQIRTPKNVNNPTFEIYGGEKGFINYYFDRTNPPAGDVYTSYKNIEKELYQFIEKRTKKSRIKINPNVREMEATNWLKDHNIAIVNNIPSGIKFSFDSFALTGMGYSNLDFDIKASMTTGTSRFAETVIYVDYNPAIFGTYVVNSGKIATTKGQIILNPDYTVTLSDETSSQVKIVVTSSLNSPNLYDLTTLSEIFCHVQLDISNLVGLPNITFDEISMQGLSSYYDTTTSTYQLYSYVIANDSINTPWNLLTIPEISYIEPDTVAAGIGEVIFIHGTNFSDTTGYISFDNADGGLGARTYACDEDILLWSDTLILVNVFSADTITYTKNSAGSGAVIVEKFSGGPIALDTLEVLYAAQTRKNHPNDNLDIKERFVDYNSGTAITKFRFSSNLPPAFQFYIKKALNEWRCKTGINIEIDVNPTNVTDIVEGDGVSVIALGDPGGTLYAKTRVWDKECQDNTGYTTSLYGYEIDIIIDSTRNWYLDTLNAPISGMAEIDFFTIIFHELGHAHLLAHSIGYEKIMHRTHLSSPYDIKRNLYWADSLGGRYISNLSNGSAITCQTGNFQPMSLYICSGSNSITQEINPTVYKIYPNPIANEIHIEGNSVEELKIILMDTQGKEILKNTYYGLHNILNMSKLSSGIYFLRIESENNNVQYKIVKPN